MAIEVRLGFRIYDIPSIDTRTCTADIDIRIFARWRDPAVHEQAVKLEGDYASVKQQLSELVEGAYYPKLEIANVVGETCEVDRGYANNDENTLGCCKAHFRCTAKVRLNSHDSLRLTSDRLKAFPFDDHSVDVILRISKRGALAAHCVPDPKYAAPHARHPKAPVGAGNVINRFDTHEWRVHSPILCSQVASDAEMTVRVPITRREGFYVLHVFMLLASLSLATGTVLFMGSLNDRANFLMTLILAQIAFLFAIKDRVPAVSYATVFDHYLYSLKGLTFVMLVIAVASELDADAASENSSILWSKKPRVEAMGGLAWLVAFVLVHVRLFLEARGLLQDRRALPPPPRWNSLGDQIEESDVEGDEARRPLSPSVLPEPLLRYSRR
mmetsp:Transcript_87/g.281  ORF Transcript_87/g.281 Transcript_87/m.281 type:complete len:385 (-) Transcript_87:113-1267(-)